MSIRGRKIFGSIAMSTGFALFVSVMLVTQYFVWSKPDTSRLGEQRIYPVSLGNGYIRYLTANESRFFRLMTNFGIPFSMIATFTGVYFSLNAFRAGIDAEIELRELRMKSGNVREHVQK